MKVRQIGKKISAAKFSRNETTKINIMNRTALQMKANRSKK